MKALVQAMARQGLRQLGSIRETATYVHYHSSSYNPTAGTVSTASTSIQLPVTFGNYTTKEILHAVGKIEKSDRPALIIPTDLQSIEPIFGDAIVRATGEVWKIVEGGIGLDPAEALYVLQTRKEYVPDEY